MRYSVAAWWFCCSVGCSFPSAPTRGPTPTAPPFVWKGVAAEPVDAEQDAPALVRAGPGTYAAISIPLRATVRRIRVQGGDLVKVGAPLFDVVVPDVLEAAGKMEGARVRLEAWTDRHRQLVALRADGLAKGAEVAEVAARVAEVTAELQSARATLLVAGIRESETHGLLSGNGEMTLKAPLTGVVTEVLVIAGETREPGTGPLMKLASLGAQRVEARFSQDVDVSSAQFISHRGGTPVEIRFVAQAPVVDSRDGTRLAWFEPVADNSSLVAGTLGRVRLSAGLSGRAHQFRVPAEAIHRDNAQVWLVTRRGQIEVRVARCESTDCIVQGELSAQDEVQVGAPP